MARDPDTGMANWVYQMTRMTSGTMAASMK
jgi:glucose dehydrogenase